MAYDEHLAERIEGVLKQRKSNYYEKKMFGGVCFMVNDKMCVGVIKDAMMVRLDPLTIESVLNEPGVKPMDFTGRPMKGYLFIAPEGVDMHEDLERWVDRCLAYNPLAKASKKR
jgi:TfoX/Sxy family transcriptional regulator of competence genes